MEKDYSLLRQFDLEAAKRGEAICTDDLDNVQYIAGPDEYSNVVLKTGPYFVLQRHRLRMSPLCWVEGRPVYKGDVLYSDKHGKGVIVEATDFNGGYAIEFEHTKISIEALYFQNRLTWTPPKVKRDGWMNCYKNGENSVYPTKERADRSADYSRVACIRIEWEE